MIRRLNPVNGPICGVFAATLATTDMPFFAVNSIAREEMAKKRWKGAMHMPALKATLSRLGVTYKDVAGLQGMPLRGVVEKLDPAKHYIVFVTGHFLTLHNGFGYDQGYTHGVPVDGFWCAGRKVIHILEIDRSKPSSLYEEMFPDD